MIRLKYFWHFTLSRPIRETTTILTEHNRWSKTIWKNFKINNVISIRWNKFWKVIYICWFKIQTYTKRRFRGSSGTLKWSKAKKEGIIWIWRGTTILIKCIFNQLRRRKSKWTQRNTSIILWTSMMETVLLKDKMGVLPLESTKTKKINFIWIK